jgi:phosphoesterase RecJ-like protein
MDPYKTSRLNNAIHRTLSELLHAAVKDPRIGFVTISGVELNRDHTLAKVYVSVMDDSEETRQLSLVGLKKARGFLQGRLGQALRLRQVPELRFIYDTSLDRSLNITTVLKDLEESGEFVAEEERRRQLSLEDLTPPDDFLSALCRGESFWVVPHWNPDPDAMGGALALAFALRAMDRDAVVFGYPDPPISVLDLPGFADTVPDDAADALLESDRPDTLVLVDCHRRERAGSLATVLEKIPHAWSIDHHMTTGRRTPVPGWQEPRACSTCTLLYRTIEVLAAGAGGRCQPFVFDLDMATCLYAGLYNDTGGFRFPNTLPVSFELAQRLASLGVDTAAVARQTLHRHRPEAVSLLRMVLGTFETTAQGRVLALHVDQTMLKEAKASLSDTEGLINIATATDGVQFVVFLKELQKGIWRLSLRSPGGGDVQAIAARYGGGGHRQAAGCTIEGDGAEIKQRLVADLVSQL